LPSPEKEEFEVILLEAIDESLKSMLGESGKELVYYQLKNSYGLRRENVPEKPELFAECLYGLFGLGAKIIEATILKNLCVKLKIKYEEKKNAKFADCIKDIAKMHRTN